MGILNKLMFWKRKDEFDFDELTDKELGKNNFSKEDFGLEEKHYGLEEKSPFPAAGIEQNQSLPPHLEETERPGNIGLTRSAPVPPRGLEGRDRDLELINSKLDTVKAILTSVDQRISNLERAAGIQKKEERLW
ncbi:MAG: hypothetical protein KKD75_06545 [Nanoarchaeota archaeon]|nr:hypothetical protein [Nanoarchaeota archaeon]MBU1631612.1 hypothetical protein [Nanoarchaeota archaeon]